MTSVSPPNISYTPESFKLETKLIVLNFLGINPHDSPSHSEHSRDVLRRRFCHSLPVSPDFHKRCNHRTSLRKQKTCDHTSPKDHPSSSTTIVDHQIPKRKARSLETMVTSSQGLKLDNGILISREQASVSHVLCSSVKRDSLPDNKNDVEISMSPCNPSSDLLNTAILFPDNMAALNPDALFASHREPPLLTPKSAGFEPSFEDWKNLEMAEETAEETVVSLTEMSPEIDEIVDSLLCDVVKAVVEREITRQQIGSGELDIGPIHSASDNEECHREINGFEDNSSATMSSSSVSIENSGPSSGGGDSITSHEIEGCCCNHMDFHTHFTSVTPGDRSKLRLHIVNQASPAEEDSVEDYMWAEIQEELSSLESELENIMTRQMNGEVLSPLLTPPLTPQTNAARILARIGDEVCARYEFQLEDALHRLFLCEEQTFSYEVFRNMAYQIIDHNLPGWRQVAFLLVYGQRVAWRAVETGHQGVGSLIHYTTQLVSDYAAEFIINQGGWGAVMNIDSSDSTPDSQIDHPLHSKQFTDQSVSLYESIKASEIFPNHLHNITCNNSSYHDPDVMTIFEDPVDMIGNFPPETPSQSSSEEQLQPQALPHLVGHALEFDYFSERFRNLNDTPYHRFYNEEFVGNMLMVGFNVMTVFGIIFFSEVWKNL